MKSCFELCSPVITIIPWNNSKTVLFAKQENAWKWKKKEENEREFVWKQIEDSQN